MACALLLAACASKPAAVGTPKLALVIGNAAYENVQVLRNPINDANDMCASLGKLGFKMLCHTNVRNHDEFEALVKGYVDQLTPNTVGVFFYSGHGVQANGANFLVPTQATVKAATEDPRAVLYSIDNLTRSLGQKPARFQLIILDACRTDLFASGPRTPASATLVRSLETVARASYGLAAIQDAPPRTTVFYATASREAASDGSGRNGAFTKHIVRNIGAPGVTVEQFMKQVTAGVVDETERIGKLQRPYSYSSFSGEFCFVTCPGSPPPPGPILPPVN